jgi:hypothetical protein
MTTDERLDRLVERHEALTMTVEIPTRDLETQRSNVDQLGSSIGRLVTVVENLAVERHERRLNRLEGGQ